VYALRSDLELARMISPQNLAIGAAAVGLTGREGDVLRKVLV
jgi:lactate permease